MNFLPNWKKMLRKLRTVSDYYYLIMPIVIVIGYMTFFQKNYYIQHIERFFSFIIVYLFILIFTRINSRIIEIILSSSLIVVTSFLVTFILGYGEVFQNRNLSFFLGIIPFIWMKNGGHFVFFIMIVLEFIFFILSWLSKFKSAVR